MSRVPFSLSLVGEHDLASAEGSFYIHKHAGEKMNVVATNVLWEDGTPFGDAFRYETLPNGARVLLLGFANSARTRYPHATVVPPAEVLGSARFRKVFEEHRPDIVVLGLRFGCADQGTTDIVLSIKKLAAGIFDGYDVPVHVVAGRDHEFYAGPCPHNTTDT